MSANNLAESPTIQHRSRHIDMFEHADCQAVQDGVIRIIHLRAADQRADILTEPMGPLPYIYQRSKLLNQEDRTVFDKRIIRESLKIHNFKYKINLPVHVTCNSINTFACTYDNILLRNTPSKSQ